MKYVAALSLEPLHDNIKILIIIFSFTETQQVSSSKEVPGS